MSSKYQVVSDDQKISPSFYFCDFDAKSRFTALRLAIEYRDLMRVMRITSELTKMRARLTVLDKYGLCRTKAQHLIPELGESCWLDFTSYTN